jgi:hypothetical protein
MQEAAVVLSVLRERGRKGLPLTQLYRQIFSKNLYEVLDGHVCLDLDCTSGIAGVPKTN